MSSRHVLLLLLLAIPIGARGGPALETFNNLPLRFEPNRGQAGSQAQFVARGRGYALYLAPREAVLSLEHSTVQMTFAGADRDARVTVLEPLPGVSNYFLGGHRVSGVPNYGKILYKDIYPGIDLIFYGKQGQLEYDLVMAPGADPSQVRLDFDGITGLRILPGGDLLLETADGEIRQRRPVVYELGGRPVEGRYVRRGRRSIAFQVAPYDRSRRLVIDPVVQFSTFVGGNANDSAAGVAVDPAGNVYLAGTTLSMNFPIANGAQTALGGGKDAFVIKLNPSGTAVGYSTYLGGIADDVAAGIAVDASGNAYVTGNTLSSNFPTTPTSLQPTFGGTASATLGDAFVAKLDANGALAYSTYLGGSGDDAAYAISLDSSGSAYVTGFTSSTNFPVTAGAFRIFLGGSSDAFITKLSPSGAALAYSTFLGGTETEQGLAIAVDSSGSAYVTGSTSSINFPVVGGIQSQCAPSQTPFTTGCADAFVTKLNPQGTLLVYSTYLGGRGTDSGRAIAVGPGNNAYVAGVTDSGNFPITGGVLQPNFASGSLGDAFVARLNSNGSALVFSTFLGGSGDEIVNGIAVDNVGSAWVTGYTNSSNFPLANHLQSTCGGTTGAACDDAFVAKLNSTGSALLFSTFLGGNAVDRAFGVALDQVGNAYVAGETQSGNFPVTNGVFQASPRGGTEAFLVKIGDTTTAGPVITGLSPSGSQAGAPGFTLTVTGSGFVPGAVVRWNNGDRLTTFQSAGLLAASIPASDVAVAGTAQVTVANPAPGGGVSNAVTFTIGGNPAPVITSVQPGSALAGGAGFILTIDGAGFVAGTVVRWNGNDRPTTVISGTRVQALIPSTDLTAGGIVQVSVFNPAPLGGISNPVGFRIDNPAPVALSLSPAGATAGGPALTLTVSGSGFVIGSLVRWNGSPRATTLVSGTQLRALIPASDIADVGAGQISVFNPAPGGGASGVLTFTIVRAPSIMTGGVVDAADFTARLAPGSIAALFGANLATLAVSATSTPLPTMLAGVTVRVDAVPAPLFFVSPGQINFEVPWEMAGRAQVSVSVDLAGTTSPPETVQLASFAPAIFSANQRGTGQGAVLIAGTGALAAPVGAFPGSRPVTRGGFVEIYGVGFGPVTNQPASAVPSGSDPLSRTTATPSVSIGGVTATVAFSGLTPGFVGLYQVNAQVPQNAATGDAAAVVLSIGGVTSNTVTIAVQ